MDVSENRHILRGLKERFGDALNIRGVIVEPTGGDGWGKVRFTLMRSVAGRRGSCVMRFRTMGQVVELEEDVNQGETI